MYTNAQAICETSDALIGEKVSLIIFFCIEININVAVQSNTTWTESVQHCRGNSACTFFTYALSTFVFS